MAPRPYLRFASLFFGLLVLLCAAVVMFGWFVHNEALIQLNRAWTPMQFNAALMFALTGLMIAALSQDRRWLANIFAIPVIVIPLLTLLEYLFGADFHIDQFFVKSYIMVGTSHPGRMATNTALCFILCGINTLLFSFSWFRRTAHFITAAVVVFIGALSLISLSAYIFHFDSSYGWGNYSPMAALTSLCFVTITAALGSLLFSLTDFNLRQRSTGLPVVTGTILLLLAMIAWQFSIQTEKRHIFSEMNSRASVFNESARIFLDERLKVLGQMAARSDAMGGLTEKYWRVDAKNYLRDIPGLLGVGAIDPESAIRWIEPLNPKAIGFKLNREPIRAKALEHARATGEITVTHAVNLLSGKFGFIAIAPLAFSNRRDGSAVFMATDYTTFFNSLIDSQTPYDFQVYQTSGGPPLLLFDRTTPQSMRVWGTDSEMHWKGVDWRISIMPRPELLRSLTTLTPILTLLLGLIFSVFASTLVHLYLISVEAKKAAEAAAEAKARFLANMSHEIRTPLNGVVGLSHLLKKTELNDQQKDYLKGIVSSAEALLTLISDILDLSKIDAGKVRLETIDFNLSQVIGDCESLLASTAQQKALTLSTEIDDNAPAWVRGDPFRLRQILLNLLSNAIKFTDSGKVMVTVRVEEKSGTGCVLCFNVVDSGIGITPENAKRLFNAFEQANSSTTRTHGGTGLGLSICKLLVQAMGGSIGATSDIGKGSTFWFRLPYGIGREQSLAVDSATPLQFGAHGRVLIAEDNLINQKIALAYLDHHGCKADAVGNGQEAVEAARTGFYRLILMDVHMPEMDGLQATHIIRQDTKEAVRTIPIIAMTANALEGDRERCLEAGMNDYISKPIDPRELARLLGKWLSR